MQLFVLISDKISKTMVISEKCFKLILPKKYNGNPVKQ